MRVLIIECNPELGRVWSRSIERLGVEVFVARSQNEAIDIIRENEVNVIILDLVIPNGSAFAVADFAAYKQPDAKVIFVTNTTFFSDGSIFRHIPNACAFLQSETPPEDLAAVVEHYGVTTASNS